MQDEIWKQISFAPGYSVSDRGRIRNDLTGRFIFSGITPQGYPKANLSVDGKSKTFLIHRIVALEFIKCDNPDSLTVNHKDGVKTNNCRENLEWLTIADNLKHARETGLRDTKGAKHPLAKFSEADIRSVCESIASGSQPMRSCEIMAG